METVGGEKEILPIWHDIFRSEVAQYLPILTVRRRSSHWVGSIARVPRCCRSGSRFRVDLERNATGGFGICAQIFESIELALMFKLEEMGYAFDEVDRIWARPGFAGIDYNDGESSELHLADIVKQAGDVGVFSCELRSKCTDWVTLYHLSPHRGNVLRPFENLLKGKVLEICAGCGAITRYLGEAGGRILALEGSPRRAAIAASRTRGLPNVTVLAERFDDLRCSETFDAITLIGVLEYAGVFGDGHTPALNMLKKARSMLRPNGRLFTAIENQLGLKYFAGAQEDHIGEPMYGIEGRYRNGQPRTYGRRALAELIAAAGFASSEFLAPFPDYKLPSSVLTEHGCAASDFDAAAFAWQSLKADPQQLRPLKFRHHADLADGLRKRSGTGAVQFLYTGRFADKATGRGRASAGISLQYWTKSPVL